MSHTTLKSGCADLVDRLNRLPLGAPPSNPLFSIVQILFAQKEARLAALLPLKPFTAETARRVWTALLDPWDIPLVPLALEAGAARDTLALTAWAHRFIAPDAFGASATAQYYAVWCTEGRPRSPAQTEAAALAAHPEFAGLITPGIEEALCRVWQPHQAPPEAATAVVSDVPVLILTGEFDPVTRPDPAP